MTFYRPTFAKPRLVLHGLRALRRLGDVNPNALALLVRIGESELSAWFKWFAAAEQANAEREAADQIAAAKAVRK